MMNPTPLSAPTRVVGDPWNRTKGSAGTATGIASGASNAPGEGV